MCFFFEPFIFGEAKSTNFRATGFWTDGRTDAILKNAFFEIPILQTKSNKNGLGKNSRVFRLARTESIPAAWIGNFSLGEIKGVVLNDAEKP